MSVTIKDIAEKANTSYPSVSRALSGKPGVSSKTREKVLKIAREMNYQPNALARSLVQNRTSTIGLIIPDILNPYFPEIVMSLNWIQGKILLPKSILSLEMCRIFLSNVPKFPDIIVSLRGYCTCPFSM